MGPKDHREGLAPLKGEGQLDPTAQPAWLVAWWGLLAWAGRGTSLPKLATQSLRQCAHLGRRSGIELHGEDCCLAGLAPRRVNTKATPKGHSLLTW